MSASSTDLPPQRRFLGDLLPLDSESSEDETSQPVAAAREPAAAERAAARQRQPVAAWPKSLMRNVNKINKPKFNAADQTMEFGRKLCDLKLASFTFAERVGLDSYLDHSPYGKYTVANWPELANIATASGAARAATPSSRGFVERMAYDSLQVAKLISQYVDEMRSCWEVLPETNWDGNGFPKAVGLSETGIPNVSAYLKRMFTWHHGELISVADEWRPYAEPTGGGAKPASGGSAYHRLASGGLELWHPQFLTCKADRQRRAGMGMDSLVYKRQPQGGIAVREALVFSLPTLVWNMWDQATLLDLYTFWMRQPLMCLKAPPRGR